MTIQEVPMYHSLSLGHAEAQLAIQSIQAELLQRGKTAVIAVADAHGELIGLLRMDGAPLPSILIASNKAWTAARERKASWELGQAAHDSQTGLISPISAIPATSAGVAVCQSVLKAPSSARSQ